MRDRRVGEQALDVLLAQRREVAERHRHGREHREDRGPARVVEDEQRAAEGLAEEAHDAAEGRGLHARGHEARHGRGRALVRVGRPHVERHGRDLERERDEDEVLAEIKERRLRGRADLAGDARVRELAARRAVDHRHAVDEEARREGAHEEVLDGALGAAQAAPPAAREDVGRERHRLDADEQRHEVRRVRDHHHAGRREEHERVELAELEALLAQVRRREQQRERRRREEGAVEVQRHAIDDEHPLEVRRGRRGVGPLAHDEAERAHAGRDAEPREARARRRRCANVSAMRITQPMAMSSSIGRVREELRRIEGAFTGRLRRWARVGAPAWARAARRAALDRCARARRASGARPRGDRGSRS